MAALVIVPIWGNWCISSIDPFTSFTSIVNVENTVWNQISPKPASFVTSCLATRRLMKPHSFLSSTLVWYTSFAWLGKPHFSKRVWTSIRKSSIWGKWNLSHLASFLSMGMRNILLPMALGRFAIQKVSPSWQVKAFLCSLIRVRHSSHFSHSNASPVQSIAIRNWRPIGNSLEILSSKHSGYKKDGHLIAPFRNKTRVGLKILKPHLYKSIT